MGEAKQGASERRVGLEASRGPALHQERRDAVRGMIQREEERERSSLEGLWEQAARNGHTGKGSERE